MSHPGAPKHYKFECKKPFLHTQYTLIKIKKNYLHKNYLHNVQTKIQDFRTEKKSRSYHGRQTKAQTRGKNQIGHTVLFSNIQCQKARSRYLQRPQGKSEKRFTSLIFFFLRYINYTYVGSSFISFLLSCIRLFIFHCVVCLLIWHIPSCLTHCVPVSSWCQHC